MEGGGTSRGIGIAYQSQGGDSAMDVGEKRQNHINIWPDAAVQPLEAARKRSGGRGVYEIRISGDKRIDEGPNGGATQIDRGGREEVTQR
ncbi:unnamed protein product [Calypogeia fissa]